MNRTLHTAILLCLFLLLSGCADKEPSDKMINPKSKSAPTNIVKLSTDIKWEALNPARGDKSPKAGTVWGDRKGEVATGFLAKFVDGFSSPPHIHNVTYRAMVLEGLVHNDDPNAEKMWMPPGSFWTQPAGESHITASKGESIAYVEIDNGPYLVKPTDEKFDNGEKPINIARNNLIWHDASRNKTIKNAKAEIAYLWEDQETEGLLIKLMSGYDGQIFTDGGILHAVIIEGELLYKEPKNEQSLTLDPGSYFSSQGSAIHTVSSSQKQDCLIYIRTNGSIEVR